jgi:hypothetical protein
MPAAELHAAFRAAQERWWRAHPGFVGALVMAPPTTIDDMLIVTGPSPQDVLDQFESSMWATPTCAAEPEKTP